MSNDVKILQADEQGRAVVGATIDGATLRNGGPNDLMSRALIVHAMPDD